MTSLRAQFTRELTIRGRAAARTIQAYLACVASLAKHYHRSPDRITDEEIRDWLAHLRTGRKLSGSSLNVAVNAVRAFQEWVLHRPREECVRGVPKCKRDVTRAEVYAQCELAAILRAAEPGRDRTLLTLIYACGLRRDEARLLQTGDIDAPRESLHVRRGKGGKPRVLPLPASHLEPLRAYWRRERAGKPGHDSPWLFQAAQPGEPMSKSLRCTCTMRGARRRSQTQGGLHVLRHSFATHLWRPASRSPWCSVCSATPAWPRPRATCTSRKGAVQRLQAPLDLIAALPK